MWLELADGLEARKKYKTCPRRASSSTPEPQIFLLTAPRQVMRGLITAPFFLAWWLDELTALFPGEPEACFHL